MARNPNCIEDVDSDNLPQPGDRIREKYLVVDVRDAELDSERNVIIKDYKAPESIFKQRPKGYVTRKN